MSYLQFVHGNYVCLPEQICYRSLRRRVLRVVWYVLSPEDGADLLLYQWPFYLCSFISRCCYMTTGLTSLQNSFKVSLKSLLWQIMTISTSILVLGRRAWLCLLDGSHLWRSPYISQKHILYDVLSMVITHWQVESWSPLLVHLMSWSGSGSVKTLSRVFVWWCWCLDVYRKSEVPRYQILSGSLIVFFSNFSFWNISFSIVNEQVSGGLAVYMSEAVVRERYQKPTEEEVCSKQCTWTLKWNCF